MIRLTHHQYTRISMLEDVLAEFADHRDAPGLYVDTWRPRNSDNSIRVSFIAEEAVIAGPGAELFAEFVLNLEVTPSGELLDEDGMLDLKDKTALDQVRDFLADRFTTTED
jgi:hypothetical protein